MYLHVCCLDNFYSSGTGYIVYLHTHRHVCLINNNLYMYTCTAIYRHIFWYAYISL